MHPQESRSIRERLAGLLSHTSINVAAAITGLTVGSLIVPTLVVVLT